MKTVLTAMKVGLLLCLAVGMLLFGFPQFPAQADYDDIVAAFADMHNGSNTTTFPATSSSYDNLRSTFGPRILSSSSSYDFHRAIDIEGSVGDDVVAPVDGEFDRYSTYSSCGHTIVLKHTFSSPITYNGRTLTQFFTWYCHLYDDGASGTDGTDDIVNNNGWVKGSPITQGTVIGKLGQSGSATFPHVHFEVRVGTDKSFNYQLTQYGPNNIKFYGFDPHMHPMLLFEPYNYNGAGTDSYSQALTVVTASPTAGSDVTVEYESTNDDMPLLNRVEVAIGGVAVSHTLDLNQRIGFNSIDPDVEYPDVPHFDPEPWSSSATNYVTNLIIPGSWTSSYSGQDVTVKAYDIWGNDESVAFTLN